MSGTRLNSFLKCLLLELFPSFLPLGKRTHDFFPSHVYDLAFLASSFADIADREEGLVGGLSSKPSEALRPSRAGLFQSHSGQLLTLYIIVLLLLVVVVITLLLLLLL